MKLLATLGIAVALLIASGWWLSSHPDLLGPRCAPEPNAGLVCGPHVAGR